MKTIEVVAAIIQKDGKILATQRGYGDMAGGWEFPGGKVEPDEALEDALVREIREELDALIEVERHVATINYSYETLHLTMHCYLASLAEGEAITLIEHSSARWVDATTADSVDWLPADILVVNELKRQGIL